MGGFHGLHRFMNIDFERILMITQIFDSEFLKGFHGLHRFFK